MAQENAITVRGVKKKFKVYYDKGTSLKEKVLFRSHRKYEERMVLRGIDLKIARGEVVGLIGENGCGKSTLLKMLTRIMYPDSGTIEVHGRISSLIELGAGFHPDMSGRENIYINASILGLTHKEIREREKDIIAFSELEEFIDNPIRTYSSGMYMRLAFAIAINVDADILLVDEILAVGDAAFQAKCFHKLREIKANGTTIVIVSHSLGSLEMICDRSVWIKDGTVHRSGSPFEVHPEYLFFMGNREEYGKLQSPAPAGEASEAAPEEAAPATPDASAEPAEEPAPPAPLATDTRWGNMAVEITDVEMKNAAGDTVSNFCTGTPLTITVHYRRHSDVPVAVFGIGIFRNDGLSCYGTNTLLDGIPPCPLQEQGIVTCHITDMTLLPGAYTLDIAIHAEDGFAYDYYRAVRSFTVFSQTADTGVARMNHVWQV